MILSYNGTSLTLSDSLQWIDRHKWSDLAVTDGRSINGKVIRQTSTKIGGRFITLQSLPDAGLVRYSQVKVLEAWQNDPDCEIDLSLFDLDLTVLWRYAGEAALIADPVLGFTNYNDDELWRVTIPLIVKV